MGRRNSMIFAAVMGATVAAATQTQADAAPSSVPPSQTPSGMAVPDVFHHRGTPVPPPGVVTVQSLPDVTSQPTAPTNDTPSISTGSASPMAQSAPPASQPGTSQQTGTTSAVTGDGSEPYVRDYHFPLAPADKLRPPDLYVVGEKENGVGGLRPLPLPGEPTPSSDAIRSISIVTGTLGYINARFTPLPDGSTRIDLVGRNGEDNEFLAKKLLDGNIPEYSQLDWLASAFIDKNGNLSDDNMFIEPHSDTSPTGKAAFHAMFQRVYNLSLTPLPSVSVNYFPDHTVTGITSFNGNDLTGKTIQSYAEVDVGYINQASESNFIRMQEHHFDAKTGEYESNPITPYLDAGIRIRGWFMEKGMRRDYRAYVLNDPVGPSVIESVSETDGKGGYFKPVTDLKRLEMYKNGTDGIFGYVSRDGRSEPVRMGLTSLADFGYVRAQSDPNAHKGDGYHYGFRHFWHHELGLGGRMQPGMPGPQQGRSNPPAMAPH